VQSDYILLRCNIRSDLTKIKYHNSHNLIYVLKNYRFYNVMLYTQRGYATVWRPSVCLWRH